VRLDDGERDLMTIRAHLTAAEAREAIAALISLLDDVERVGLSVSHRQLGSSPVEPELILYVHPEAEATEAIETPS
jgi:hypothetical protein